MYQQINMYRPVFRQQPKTFSTSTLLKIIALIVIVMFAVYIHAFIKLKDLQRMSDELASSYNLLDVQLGAASPDILGSENSVTDEELYILQSQIDNQNALLENIDSHFNNVTINFADVFEILAKNNVSGLWLTGVSVTQNGSLEIRGATLDQNAVPGYLQSLSRSVALSNLGNGTVKLYRDNVDQEEINFTLSYSADGEEP